MQSTSNPPVKPSRGWLRIGFFAAIFLAAFGCSEGYRPVTEQTDASGTVEEQKSAKRPVILLTGYEPFGPGRPANSSWEGIKKLDGKHWKKYLLICKEMPVVWGAPLKSLPGWISEHKPIAVFSFGQGLPDAFALETKASNQRGNIPDNLGDLPPTPTITQDGPGEFEATINSAKLARTLADKGYTMRVSKTAGRYLCEEALYSLEYLKSTKKLQADVLFCHVPPLGSSIGSKSVTPEYVQEYVQDLLEAWQSLEATPPAAKK